MKLIRYIAFPFVPVYYLVTWLRNRLYDLGIKKSKSYNFPVICVGNLSVGGTGKTPMIEYLIALLKNDYNVATLSRGYKRKTTGFQLGNHESSAESLGDEPYQFYSKFGSAISVAVDADRTHGINELRHLENVPEIILLDDAFQHRKVKTGLNVLLTTFENLYVNDFVLPTGNLREPQSGAKRADIIIVTKCPHVVSENKKAEIIKLINPLPYQSVFFSSIKYGNQIISESSIKPLEQINDFTLVTGIANAEPLVNYLKTKKLHFEHLNYKDHHEFSDQDIKILEEKALILTTEKDFVRLKKYVKLKDKLYYLPIVVELNDPLKFKQQIMAFLTRF
ncbi:tetraacyldisaccharide 4'-kinase [Changchengzhania lutea]|uniref:tetraacyldisaccharide 4'-kinase n=1 Tax=Changchengzhania lutea TaxID=2049305 RepID=UPI00115E0609|nr:tetraacyldisaccharide 4'-kinase [Changchengzhania lutea]